MTDAGSDSSTPIAPDELHIEVRAGENVQVSAPVREALEHLARILDEEADVMKEEVSGFAWDTGGLQVGSLAQPGGAGAAGAAAGCGNLCIIRIRCKLGISPLAGGGTAGGIGGI